MDTIPQRPRRLAMSARRSVIPLYTPILAPASGPLPATPFPGICLLTLPAPHGNLPCQSYRSNYHGRASPPVPLIPQATAIPPTLLITAFTHPRRDPPLIRQISTGPSLRLPPSPRLLASTKNKAAVTLSLQWKKKTKVGTRNDTVAQGGIYSRHLRDQDHRGLALSGENGAVDLKVERSSGYKNRGQVKSNDIQGVGGVFG